MAEMSKIEEVARAIYEKRNGAGARPWPRQPASHKAPYLDDARAAIEAMRVPTPVMIAAGKFRYRDIDLGNGTTVRGLALGDDPLHSYRKIIDAALSEEVAG